MSPTLWLAALLFLAVSCAGSYFIGVRHEHNAMLAAQVKELAAERVQAHENAVVDMQAAVDAEAARQTTRVEYRNRNVEVERIIHAKPSECTIPDELVRVLNAGIDAANGSAAAKPGAVPPAATPRDK